MSGEKPERKVVDLSFWREAHGSNDPDDGGGGGPGGPTDPPIGPPGGDGSTPQPVYGGEDHISEELSKELGEDWKCAWPSGEWYRWDGLRWDNRAGDFPVRQKVQLIARQLGAVLKDQRLARQMARKATGNGAVSWASSNERHAIWEGEFDLEEDWEINTPAGLLDLHSGFLAKHIRSRMLTRLTGAAPMPDAECPRWLQFLDEATAGDKQLQDYLQRMVGYFLTGLVNEHLIFFMYGKSRTGKSVFVSVLRALVGDYAINASVDMFIESDGQRHQTEVMDLKGPRLVVASETPAGKRWNDALLKQISGGDRIRAHYMRQDTEEFAPKCKLLLVGNHRPKIRDGDDAMFERFLVIPFRHRQPVLDKGLVDKLKLELPGIFKWAVEGEIKRLAGAHLGRDQAPVAIKEATDEYFEAEDLIRQWLEECCVFNKTFESKTEELYRSFRTWSERNGERFPPSLSTFAVKLALVDEHGIEKYRKKNSRGFRGVALRQSQSDMPL